MNHIMGKSGTSPITEAVIESILHNDSLSIIEIN